MKQQDNEEVRRKQATLDLIKSHQNNIIEHGFSVQCVMPRAGSSDLDRPFAYTLGLSPKMPEFIISGLSAQQSLDTFWSIVRSHKFSPAHHGSINPNFANVPVAFIKVWPAIKDMASLTKIIRPMGFSMLQVIWPDANGKFRWDEGYDQTMLPLQEIYGDIPPRFTRMESIDVVDVFTHKNPE